MFDLIKFISPDYVETFLDGKLYMNSIGYFWNNGTEGQRDFSEGTAFFSNPEEFLPHEWSQHTLGSVGMRSENYKYVNVLCLYRLDRYLNQIKRIDSRVRNFGTYAIHITNADLFIAKVMKALSLHSDLFYCCGDIQYYDFFDLSNRDKILGAFCKATEFDYQSEWRIATLPNYSFLRKRAPLEINKPYNTHLVIDIGDIRSFAKVTTSQTIVNNENHYFNQGIIVDSLKKDKKLSPQIADEWFAKGVQFPRNTLDGAYWGNCNKELFDRRVLSISENNYKPFFTFG